MEVRGMVSSGSGQRRSSQENKRKPERFSRSGQGRGSAGSNSLVRSSRLKVWEGLLNLAARKFSRSVKEEKGGQPMEASLPRSWTSMGTRKSRIKTKQPFRLSRLEDRNINKPCPSSSEMG